MFGILFLSLKRSLKRNLVNLIFPRGRVPGGGGVPHKYNRLYGYENKGKYFLSYHLSSIGMIAEIKMALKTRMTEPDDSQGINTETVILHKFLRNAIQTFFQLVSNTITGYAPSKLKQLGH